MGLGTGLPSKLINTPVRIAEIISPAHRPRVVWVRESDKSRRRLPPSGTQAADSNDVKEAARTMVDWLRALRDARFTLYGPDLAPVLIGQVRHGNLHPENLVQRLVAPTIRGYIADIEILEPFHKWFSIVCGPGGGPARRVIRWRSVPRSQAGKPWIQSVSPDRMRRTTTTIGDLIAGAAGEF